MISLIEDNESRLAVYGSKEALDCLRAKINKVKFNESNKSVSLMNLVREVRAFNQALENSSFENLLAELVDIAGTSSSNKKTETPVISEKVGTA